ncbi:sigma-70 family RNA polymerase sigma factor [Devosia sp. SL43]|uniref:sigma-70 family RNA polymerase sigma factor n=1 Tax=Devosia sp. SL43 TaxID=2806348 RepID=UPI001F032523|nr:sigma-70 family RNA polymerase sigma factor [Devosia sp. SL43]UJW86749.1 sigma-70 family RNA polymerase sigma factor [Devosia sp. SL43]
MSDLIDTDDLLRRVAAGERGALAQLFNSESGRLVAIAQRIVRRRDLAEEVVQEIFVTVWRKAAQFDGARGNGRAWLTVMARNRALNLLRNDARVEYHDETDLADLGDRQADAVSAFDTLAERDALRTCLERLDEPKRRAILLCYVTGLNHGEAAATMNAPLGTVKAWIRRGVVSLQECLS